MKKILTTIGAVVFSLGCSTLPQDRNNPNETKNIEGVWIINNADSPKHFSNGFYKVICADQHRVIRIRDGILQGIHGGYVSFDGQVMVEKPRFQTGNGFLGKTFKFNVKPDGSSFLQTGIKGSGSFENLKEQWVKVGSANHNIEGVWMRKLNNGRVMVKMIVDNFWNWIVVDPKTNNVTAALGGSYDYDGENYVETSHFKYGEAERMELGRKWEVVAELKEGNLLFHGKNDGGNDFTENWVKYDATSIKKQDPPSSQEQNKQAGDASFEQRMKQARKPYNFINVSYMDVKDGMEEEYLKVESAWKKIHEKLASEGKIISWGLAKARKNEFGYEYITWVILRSRGALDNLYDMKALKAWMGEDKMDDLMAKTMKTRSITGGELLTLEDYTLVSLDPPNEVVDSKNFFFHWNFMTPTEGKAQDYVNTEKNAFQPRHQKKSELNPRFQWWNLQKQILSWGSVNKAPYRTVDFFRNDVAQPSDKELEKINAQMPAFPEGLTYQNVMKMREMKRVTFDVVHLIDRSMSAETKAWETLIGTWTAPSATQWEKGAYRRKTITPYTEVFELFDAEGKVIDRQKKPLSIEVINGINYFTIYPPNNEASFPFKIVDGKWYENMRGMLSNNSEKPDQFLVYKKTDQPVFSDKSSFTKKGEDVELVKAIIENYASGKIDEYLALFTEDAKVTHNNNEPITISELAKTHRVHHEQIAGPVKILSSNYEVVATANGNKYGHAWVKFENTYKNGSKAVTPVFVSFGINNNGKIYFEHALYDTATVPDDSVYNKN